MSTAQKEYLAMWPQTANCRLSRFERDNCSPAGAKHGSAVAVFTVTVMSGVAAADPLLLDPAAKKLPPLPPHVASSVSLDTLTESDSDESRSRSEASAADSMLQEEPCVATLQDIGECVPVLVQDYIDLELRKPHQAVGIKDKVPLCASAVLKKESSTGEKWRRVSWTLVLFLVVGSLLIVLGRVHLTQLLKCLEDLPLLQSLFIFIFLFTLVSFPFGFGYIILNLMAGYLYGFVRGQIVVMVSVAVGFSVSFLLCRSWMRDYARGIITSAALQAIMRVVEGPNANEVMLLMRLTPIPFGLQNVLFAVSQAD